jgi:hypothetical protein
VYPVIFVDAINVKIRDGQVANRPIYVALAVTCDGNREVLGLWAGVTSGVGSMPRSSASCPDGSSRARALAVSTPSSASVCADPTCFTIRCRPPTHSAICTAVAPDAVRTRRMNTTPASLVACRL